MSFLLSLFRPLAYISLPVLFIRTVSSSSPRGQYYVRRGLYLSCMTAIATWGVAVAATLSLTGHRYDVNWVIARAFYALAGSVLDINIEVEGEEHLRTKPAVLLSNHQSMLDILFVGRLMPKRTSIMAKKSLQFTPLGPFMIMSGAVFIDRGNNARAVRSLDAAGQLMKDREISLWMYPEGTRHLSEQPSMLPFKKGAFHLAVQAGIPIVPMVTENYWRVYRDGWFGKGVIRVRVLPPISTQGMTPDDVPELTKRVRDLMMDALRDISVKTDTPSPSELGRESDVDDEKRQQGSSQPITTFATGSTKAPDSDELPPANTDSDTDATASTIPLPVPIPSSQTSSQTKIAPEQQTLGQAQHDESDAGAFSPPDVVGHTTSSEEEINTSARSGTRTRTDSTISLASSGVRSDAGTETSTEEDEGMVLVGRPT
ncbi:hypothetical protein GYMLUDRAFT_39718 [Collybiopsis luxurians FD-317 M1]|nr:hypothetical protein GYMLUDRAFT_39718 [Collybiopsis luxurians FD-317 M1]